MSRARESNPCKIFIGGLPSSCQDGDLSELFGQYGEITDCIAMKEAGGKPRGFGYVTFSDPSAVDAVMQEYASHQIHNKWVEVKTCVPKEDSSPIYDDKKFFIGGLSADTTTEDIGEYFSAYGDITDCIAMVDSEGNPRGFGYCTFTSPNDLQAVLKDYDQHQIKGKWVEVQQVVPKNKGAKGGKGGFGGGGKGKGGGKGFGGGGGKGFGGGGKGKGGGKGFGGGGGKGGKGKGGRPY